MRKNDATYQSFMQLHSHGKAENYEQIEHSYEAYINEKKSKDKKMTENDRKRTEK